MTARLILAACFLLSAFSAAHADDKIAKIVSGDEIALTDGRIIRLSGIKSFPQAQDFLQNNVAGHDLVLQDAVIDRYGRVAATVFAQGQSQSLQDALLRNGLAFVYPALGNEPHLDDMLQAEQTARKTGQGVWPQHTDISSDDAEKLYGHYGFVSGKVVKAERVKNKLYLNFGPDWHTDFTIAIAAHDLRAFKKADLNPLDWQGKNVRVRGWVKRDYGPMITITDPHQIEVTD